MNNSVGNRVKNLRKDYLKLTLKEFSKIIGITNSFISGIETLKKNPSYRLLVQINKKFHVSIDWLLTGEGDVFLRRNPCADAGSRHQGLRLSTDDIESGEYEAIEGRAEVFPVNGDNIHHTHWFERLSKDEKWLVAAINTEGILDTELTAKIKAFIQVEHRLKEAQKKEDEERQADLKQKGEAG